MFAAQAKGRLVSTRCSDMGTDRVAKRAHYNYDLDVISDQNGAQKAGYLRRNRGASAVHQHNARNTQTGIIEVDPFEGSETTRS